MNEQSHCITITYDATYLMAETDDEIIWAVHSTLTHNLFLVFLLFQKTIFSYENQRKYSENYRNNKTIHKHRAQNTGKKTLYFFIGQFLLTLSANCYFVSYGNWSFVLCCVFFTVIYLAFGELRCQCLGVRRRAQMQNDSGRDLLLCAEVKFVLS